jgi:hypothetical protein
MVIDGLHCSKTISNKGKQTTNESPWKHCSETQLSPTTNPNGDPFWVGRREGGQIKFTVSGEWVVLKNDFFVLVVLLENESNSYVTYTLYRYANSTLVSPFGLPCWT